MCFKTYVIISDFRSNYMQIIQISELNLFWIEEDEDPPCHQLFQCVVFPLAYFLQKP
jgi:hypothetical protein